MDNAGEEAPAKVKRLRRPSVRLNHPYYEYPHQWKVSTKKPRTLKNVHPNNEEIEDDDDNIAIGNWNRRADFKRKRVRSSNSTKLGPEKSPSPSPSNKEEEDLGGNGISRRKDLDDDGKKGVRMWLNRLGLGKYGRVFEVHGVDDQVLPFLTLEDLKEMGIAEIGIRRKMFCSIQKLSAGPGVL